MVELKANPRGYPTWWAKGRLNDGTTNAEARKEFQRMEREGLVSRKRSHSNCIVWQDKDGAAIDAQLYAARGYECARNYKGHSDNREVTADWQRRYEKEAVKYQREGAKESVIARKLMGVE